MLTVRMKLLNYVVWMKGKKGPTLVMLVDREWPTKPTLTDWESKAALGPPIALAPAEQWLRLDQLAALYPAPSLEPEPEPAQGVLQLA